MLSTGVVQQTKFDLAAYDFGGYEAVRRDFGITTLSDVFAFPGAIKTINLWLGSDEPTDLTQAGFIPGGSYEVFDKDFRFLYGVSQADNFGLSQADVNFLEQAPHGSYYYVRFDSHQGRSLVLVWICKEPDPDLKRLIAEQWRQHHQSFIRPNLNELYLDTTELTATTEIFWVVLTGNFNVNVTLSTLRAQGEYHKFNPRYPIYIRPRTNMWFAFLQDEQPLRISKVLGDGVERFRERNGIFHLELQSRRTWQGVVRLTLTLQDALPPLPPPSPPMIPPPLIGDGGLLLLPRIAASARNISHGASLLVGPSLVFNGTAASVNRSSGTLTALQPIIDAQAVSIASADGAFIPQQLVLQAEAALILEGGSILQSG